MGELSLENVFIDSSVLLNQNLLKVNKKVLFNFTAVGLY